MIKFVSRVDIFEQDGRSAYDAQGGERGGVAAMSKFFCIALKLCKS